MSMDYAHLFDGGSASRPAGASPAAGASAQKGTTPSVPPSAVAPLPQAAAYRLLFVDDEPGILNALRRVFRKENYAIHTAACAEDAFSMMATESFHLVMSDFNMPGMNGADFLSEVRRRWPSTIRVMLTGQADTNAVMGAIKAGAVYRFILKPWNDDDIRVTVGLALEQHDLMEKNRKLEATTQKQEKDLETLAKLSASNRSQLAILLHKKGMLTSQQLQGLHRDIQGKKISTMALLLEKNFMTERQVFDLLKGEMMFEEVDLKEISIDPSVAALVPRSLCHRNQLIPLRVFNKRLKLVMADPMDMGLIEELGFSTGLQIEPVIAPFTVLKNKLVEVFGESDVSIKDLETSMVDPFENIEIVIDEDEQVDVAELLASSDEPPAIRMVNAIIMEAIRHKASDIHIQPKSQVTVIRYRIDGVLTDKIHIPLHLHASVVSRIKIMAELDISERRRPQDGRITVKTPMRIVDLRISTLPTLNGEKVVMRLLDRQGAISHMDQLGLSESDRQKLEFIVTKPQGIILATGPTGSGKTTTLYAMLQHNASAQKNYVTIEDPVEFYMDMAGQVPIKERIGLSFATVLRAILRQDPDVVLLGEIRDVETAEAAFHAAMTGHIVYSTLHTNSAATTIARLLDMGLKPFVLTAVMEAIIAQRLMRKVCMHCREEVPAPTEILKHLGPKFVGIKGPFYEAKGCMHCVKGYSGRVGVYEIMLFNEALRDAVIRGEPPRVLQNLAVENGMNTLLDEAHERLVQGMTTAEEILRVFGAQ